MKAARHASSERSGRLRGLPALLFAAAMVVAAPEPRAGDGVASLLESARLSIRRGDLVAAEATLDRVNRGAATERQVALLALNRGNVDFWAHRLTDAREHFVEARDGFAALDAAAPGSEAHVLSVAQDNVDLVDEELTRAVRLADRASALRTWLVVAVLVCVVTLGALLRGSRAR